MKMKENTNTGPPMMSPITNTSDSVVILTARMEYPVLSEMTSIKPSRGPAPRRTELYIPPPMPMMMIPTVMITASKNKLFVSGTKSNHKKKSIKIPTKMILMYVPALTYVRSRKSVTNVNARPIMMPQLPIVKPNLS